MPARGAGGLKVMHHGGAGHEELGYAPRGGVFLSKRAKKPERRARVRARRPARRAGVRRVARHGDTRPRWPGYVLKVDAFSSGGHPEGRGPRCRNRAKSGGHQAKTRVLKPRKAEPEAIQGSANIFLTGWSPSSPSWYRDARQNIQAWQKLRVDYSHRKKFPTTRVQVLARVLAMHHFGVSIEGWAGVVVVSLSGGPT